MSELITEHGENQTRVVGAVVKLLDNGNSKTIRIKARKAVMLAAGGFEHNQAMREQYLPAPTSTAWSAGIKTNTGDAIVAGQAINAKTAQMDSAWWCSTVTVPGREYPFLSIVTKSMPGTFVVNQSGKRYANESQNYMSWSQELFKVHNGDNNCVPSFMVFDVKFKNKYSAFPLTGPDWILPKSFFESGLVTKADSIRELAEKAGIDADQLEQTVAQFNQYARTGKDLDFQRGDAAYDRYYGDPLVEPNPCLATLSKPPYYAMRTDAGDFGTHGGLVTDPNGQVLGQDSQAIPGLYATGNCSSAVLPTYPGPGSTLGPAMTFAYQAAKHISQYRE
jgi:3-oxosteroid 1-dehydrogenase